MRRQPLYRFFLPVWLVVLTQCRPHPGPPPALAFYHWKSELQLSASELEVLRTNAVELLYIRLFDIDWEDSPVPKGVLQATAHWPTTAFIPTIFITNRTFEALATEAIPELASKIVKKVSALIPPAQLPLVRGFQVDCDWTESTRPIYFDLLRELKAQLGAPYDQSFSATIRLHQIKYFERTGVPPVDRGMLMYYNMSPVMDPKTTNSILDLGEAAKYQVNFDRYPLPLDLALPMYSWGVLIREGKVIRLINNLGPEALSDTARFQAAGGAFFEVKKSTYLEGYYLYRGDRIRLELVEADTLVAAVQQLRGLLPPAPRHLTFYHLDSLTVNRYAYDFYEKLRIQMEE